MSLLTKKNIGIALLSSSALIANFSEQAGNAYHSGAATTDVFYTVGAVHEGLTGKTTSTFEKATQIPTVGVLLGFTGGVLSSFIDPKKPEQVNFSAAGLASLPFNALAGIAGGVAKGFEDKNPTAEATAYRASGQTSMDYARDQASLKLSIRSL